jgi:hypothetical protein
MSHERRRDVRVRILLPAERVLLGRVEPVEIVEVSYRGLLFTTASAPPAINELIRLRVSLPSGPISLHAVPVRETSHRGAPAFGCKLFALGGEHKDAWQAFVAYALRADASAA